ncbi:PR-1-like protein [Conidiobolus coronatus NRRL 28638]|uniref:PR-1-like protein n=1 Tax=Conidiobolus coronatus (strain ATCC 28846 / CBS 209.66 / NRRL 28638) TaxID=796925 RepID=A0A137NS95_CONC2|nr:PR-1-like protein [Conidiobolus coronatus NRRL 28638]|eukprot:KXN65618.1 PR-1-like protein [Conidiobolus coronatus NRRL 28638]
MKYATLLLATIVSSMPSFKSGQGHGNGGMSNRDDWDQEDNGNQWDQGGQDDSDKSSSQGSSTDEQNLQELNKIRAKVGAPPLKLSHKLTQAAQKHSDDQAQMHNMSHTGSDGSSPTQRIHRSGISGGATGENVAWNQRDWSVANEVWVHSPGHYQNMIDKDFKYVGFGVTNRYYTEDFSSND